jgi:hypothetical protein
MGAESIPPDGSSAGVSGDRSMGDPEDNMWDILFIGLFVLLAFVLTADSLNKYRFSRKWMYAVAAVTGGLAMAASLIWLEGGIFFIILTIILRIVAGLMK